MVDVKEELKRQVKKRVFSTVLKASLPWLLPILGIGFLIIFIIAVLTSLCNPQDFKTWFAQQGLEWTGILPSSACEAFSGFKGVVGGLARVDITGPPVEGGSCPLIKPPPRVTVGCIDCVDLKTVIPEVSIKNNSLANRGMASKLRRLANVNQTFRVTEAFCPTPNPNAPDAYPHASHDHYNGYAVDVNVKPGLEGKKDILAKLYQDIESLGVVDLRCEYPVGYLDEFGISCRASPLSTGGHIHFIEPHHQI